MNTRATEIDSQQSRADAEDRGRKMQWYTWTAHRRSTELADYFGAELVVLETRLSGLLRYMFLSARTIVKILRDKPRVVFCQNPSIVLAALLCALRKLNRYTLLVDRHSSFKFESRGCRSLKWRLFHAISDYTLRKADVTIVTNDYLKRFVEQTGGASAILQDKLPRLPLATRRDLGPGLHVMFVCTFSPDEPVEAVVAAAGQLDVEATIHITGRQKGKWIGATLIRSGLGVVKFEGFLAEADYQSLALSCDCVMVLTTAEHTLTCGAYEAVSVARPMVLSNSQAIRSYFVKGAVYVDARADQIAEGIRDCLRNQERLSVEVLALKEALTADWPRQAQEITRLLISRAAVH